MTSFLDIFFHTNQSVDADSSKRAEAEAAETLRQDGLFGGKAPAATIADGSAGKDAVAPPQPIDDLQFKIPSKDISLTNNDFDRLGADLAKALKANFDRISLHPEGGSALLFAERSGTLEISLEPSRGCRKITIDPEVRATLKPESDGSISINNISGLHAEVDPGKTRFGIPLPWLTANIQSLNIKRNADGSATVTIDAAESLTGIAKTKEINLTPEQFQKLALQIRQINTAINDTGGGGGANPVPDVSRFKQPEQDQGYLKEIGALLLGALGAYGGWKMTAPWRERIAREGALMGRDSTEPARVTYIDGKAVKDGDIIGTAGESKARINLDKSGKITLSGLDDNGSIFVKAADGEIRAYHSGKSSVPFEIKSGEQISLAGSKFHAVEQEPASEFAFKIAKPGFNGSPDVHAIRAPSADNVMITPFMGDTRMLGMYWNRVADQLSSGMDEKGIYIVDGRKIQGSNEVVPSQGPITVNGQPLEPGVKRYLKPQDKIQIGTLESQGFGEITLVPANLPTEHQMFPTRLEPNGRIIKTDSGSYGAALGPEHEVVLGKKGDLNVGGSELADAHASIRLDDHGNAFIRLLPDGEGKGAWIKRSDGSEMNITSTKDWVPISSEDKISVGGSKFFSLEAANVPKESIYVGERVVSIAPGEAIAIDQSGRMEKQPLRGDEDVKWPGNDPPRLRNFDNRSLILDGSDSVEIYVNNERIHGHKRALLKNNDVITIGGPNSAKPIKVADIQPTSFHGRQVINGEPVALNGGPYQLVDYRGTARVVAAVDAEKAMVCLVSPDGSLAGHTDTRWRSTNSGENAEWVRGNFQKTTFNTEDPATRIYVDKKGNAYEIAFSQAFGEISTNPIAIRPRTDLNIVPVNDPDLKQLPRRANRGGTASGGDGAADVAPLDNKNWSAAENEHGAKKVGEIDGLPILIQGGRGEELERNVVPLNRIEAEGLGKLYSDYEAVQIYMGGDHHQYFRKRGTGQFFVKVDSANGGSKLVQDYEVFLGSRNSAAEAAALQAPKLEPSAPGDFSNFSFKAAGREIELSPGKKIFVIGRSSQSDIRVNSSSVSREHCQIEMHSDGPYVRDLHSTNGTRILRKGGGSVKLDDQPVKLNPGDVVFMGYDSTFELDAKPGTEGGGGGIGRTPDKKGDDPGGKPGGNIDKSDDHPGGEDGGAGVPRPDPRKDGGGAQGKPADNGGTGMGEKGQPGINGSDGMNDKSNDGGAAGAGNPIVDEKISVGLSDRQMQTYLDFIASNTAGNSPDFLKQLADAGRTVLANEFEWGQGAQDALVRQALEKTIIASDEIQVGSRLVIRDKSGAEIKIKGVIADASNPASSMLLTESGTAINSSEVSFEIQLPRGISLSDAARETLVRFSELKSKLSTPDQNVKGSSLSTAQLSERIRSLQDAHATNAVLVSPELASANSGGGSLLKLDADANVALKITDNGIVIGDQRLSDVELADRAIRQRRDELASLEKSRENPTRAEELRQELINLEQLQAKLTANDPTALSGVQDAMRENLPEALNAAKRGPGALTEFCRKSGKASAYLILIATVAGVIYADTRTQGYHPHKKVG